MKTDGAGLEVWVLHPVREPSSDSPYLLPDLHFCKVWQSEPDVLFVRLHSRKPRICHPIQTFVVQVIVRVTQYKDFWGQLSLLQIVILSLLSLLANYLMSLNFNVRTFKVGITMPIWVVNSWVSHEITYDPPWWKLHYGHLYATAFFCTPSLLNCERNSKSLTTS